MQYADLLGPEALTFDDVLLVPGFAEVLPSEVDIRTRLHGRLQLNVPVLFAAMDTVTEARLAITLARQGAVAWSDQPSVPPSRPTRWIKSNAPKRARSSIRLPSA